MGYDNLSEDDLNKAFQRFKQLADHKKIVTDADLEAIITDEVYQPKEIWRLNYVQVSCGDHLTPTATVSLFSPTGEETIDASIGTGPVDAVYQAINRIVKEENTLTEFTVKAVTDGIDALGEVTIRVEPKPITTNVPDEYSTHPQTGAYIKKTYSGHGADTDIIVASARAYMSALNKMLAAREETSATIRQ